MRLTVFYGSQVCDTFVSWRCLWAAIPATDPIYQEGVVYVGYESIKIGWYSCDGCPMLPEDVPKRIRMLQLVLNL